MAAQRAAIAVFFRAGMLWRCSGTVGRAGAAVSGEAAVPHISWSSRKDASRVSVWVNDGLYQVMAQPKLNSSSVTPQIANWKHRRLQRWLWSKPVEKRR